VTEHLSTYIADVSRHREKLATIIDGDGYDLRDYWLAAKPEVSQAFRLALTEAIEQRTATHVAGYLDEIDDGLEKLFALAFSVVNSEATKADYQEASGKLLDVIGHVEAFLLSFRVLESLR